MKKYLREDSTNYFETKKALQVYLLQDSKNLNQEVVDQISPDKLGDFTYKILDLLNNPNHPPGNSREITERIDKIIKTLSES